VAEEGTTHSSQQKCLLLSAKLSVLCSWKKEDTAHSHSPSPRTGATANGAIEGMLSKGSHAGVAGEEDNNGGELRRCQEIGP